MENPIDHIIGKMFCLSGGFEHFATKKDAYNAIMECGGNATDRLTQSCDYLVQGLKGSKTYSCGSYGNKIVEAIEWQKSGIRIQIISERQLIDMLAVCPTDGVPHGVFLESASDTLEYKHEEVVKFRTDEFDLSEDIEISVKYNRMEPNCRQVLYWYYRCYSEKNLRF